METVKDKIIKKIKKMFHKHKWEKLGGKSNIGGGSFLQKYRCSECGAFAESTF